MKPVDFVIAAVVAAYLAVRWRRLSREGRALLAVVAAGLAVYGTGVVALPNFEHVIKDVGTSLGSWTYLLVGVMAFAETGAFLGFVAPGEVTVIVGGVVAGQGKIDVVVLIGLVWVAAVAGDMTSYYLGRRLGREFMVRHGGRVRVTPERLDKVEDFFARRGGTTILVGRFIGIVRQLAPFLAGSTRMPFRRFVPYDVLAAGLWSTTFVLLGYVFWQSFDQVAAIAKNGALALGGAVVLVAAVIAVIRHRHDLQRRALATRGGRAVAGLVRFAWDRMTPGNLGLELTTLLAVVAVGLFAFFGYLQAVQDGGLTPGDRQALEIAANLRSGPGLSAARVLTWWGAAPVAWSLILLAAAWLARHGRRLEAGVLLAGLALTALLVYLVKVGVDRPRPPHPLTRTLDPSFPSGHTAYATALVAAAVALWRGEPAVRRWSIVLVAVALAVVVGLTRIYLRAHYLSDVVAGAGLTAAIFAGCGTLALVVDFVRHTEGR